MQAGRVPTPGISRRKAHGSPAACPLRGRLPYPITSTTAASLKTPHTPRGRGVHAELSGLTQSSSVSSTDRRRRPADRHADLGSKDGRPCKTLGWETTAERMLEPLTATGVSGLLSPPITSGDISRTSPTQTAPVTARARLAGARSSVCNCRGGLNGTWTVGVRRNLRHSQHARRHRGQSAAAWRVGRHLGVRRVRRQRGHRCRPRPGPHLPPGCARTAAPTGLSGWSWDRAEEFLHRTAVASLY